MKVTDEDAALACLERIGYYRLSGYWFPFRERSNEVCIVKPENRRKFRRARTDKLALDTFKSGTEFRQALELYVFDKCLRLLTLDALERIEIAIRGDVAHNLGKYDAFAYLKSDLFRDDFAKEINRETGLTRHHQWLQNHARLIKRSKEHFIQHNKDKYGYPLAIWVACEVWDFGTLSNLFAGMKPEDQDAIATKYGISKGATFASWLRCLSYLRNVCAHHSRLWNRNITDQPKKPNAIRSAPFLRDAWDHTHILARPFLLFCIIQFLLNSIHPNSTWWRRLTEHMDTFPDLRHLDVSLEGMGVITGWRTWDWSKYRQ